MTRRGVVFLGPSLPEAEARAILDGGGAAAAGGVEWTVLPPVRMGDVYACLGEGLAAVVVIDGVFHGQPAVWQRELLAALDGGVPVYGAASMGALRAAELDTLGMIGVGRVHGWYRDGRIEGDDEVALRHGPADADWLPLSVPLVNTRATVEAAVTSGAVSPSEGDAVVAAARARFYPERTDGNLWTDLAAEGAVTTLRSREIRAALGAHRTDVKAADARAVLALAVAELSEAEVLRTGHASGQRRPFPPVAAGPMRWRLDRILRGTFGGRLGADLARDLRDVPGLVRRVRLEAFALVACGPCGDPPGADFSAPEDSGILPGEALERVARRLRLEAAVRSHGSIEAAAAAWSQGRAGGPGAAAPQIAEVLAEGGPTLYGLPWEADVALVEAWQMDTLCGPPGWGPAAT